MKRILLSLLTIGLVTAVAFGAARAYFSNSETSNDNTFTAGTLDLNVDDGNANVVKFTIADFKPGDQQSGTWTLANVGSLDGYLDLENISVVGYENACLDPETDVGDNTCGNPGSGKGELQQVVNLKLFWDQDCDESIDEGDTVFYDGMVGSLVSSYDQSKLLNAGASTCLTALFDWGSSSSDNLAQGDSMDFDIEFELGQNSSQ